MKQKKVLLKIFVIFIFFLFMLESNLHADVGDFETYSSDSDSSWSSSDYGSSWSSSDYGSSWSSRDDDYDYSYRSRKSGQNYNKDSEMGLKEWGIIMIIGIAIVIWVIKTDKKRAQRYYESSFEDTLNDNKLDKDLDEDSIINKVKETDPLFNGEEFSSWARDLFIKLQYAWSDRDWSEMRYFETKELYEQHYNQLQRYIINRQINKMERVSVNSIRYLSFEQTEEKDVLSVVLNSKLIDYIIDEGTGQVVKGDKNTYKFNNYKLTFVRQKGIKTKPGEKKLKVTNCPNCGAPTEITSVGKCSYCGSVITTNEHDWVLSNLERYI